MQTMDMFRPLMFWNIVKTKFRMKASMVMLLKSLFNKRQEDSDLFERDAQMAVLSALDLFTALIVFSDSPTLNVIAYVVRRFTNQSRSFFYCHEFEIVHHSISLPT